MLFRSESDGVSRLDSVKMISVAKFTSLWVALSRTRHLSTEASIYGANGLVATYEMFFFSHGRRGRGGLISGPKISSADRPGVGLGAPIILVSPIPHPDFSGPPENSPRAMARLTPKPKIFRRVKFSEESTGDSRTTNAKQKTQPEKNRSATPSSTPSSKCG